MSERRHSPAIISLLAAVPGLSRALYHLARWVWVPVVSVIAVLGFSGGSARDIPRYAAGDIPSGDVIAPIGFTVRKSDEEIALEAEGLARSIKPLFDYRQSVYDSVAARVDTFFVAVSRADEGGSESLPPADSVMRAGRALGVLLTPAEIAHLRTPARRRAVQQAVTTHLERVLARGVVSAGVLTAVPAREVIVRRARSERAVLRDSILTYEAYLARAPSALPDTAPALARQIHQKIAQAVFRPTVVFNNAETERLRDELRRSVDPVKYVVRAGERIVTGHEPVTVEARERLEVLRNELASRGGQGLTLRRLAGPMLTLVLVFSVFALLLVLYRRESYSELPQVWLFGGLFVFAVIGGALVAQFVPGRPEFVPIPLVAMLITALFNGRMSLIAVMVVAVAIGIQPVFRTTPALVLILVPGVTAALSLRMIRQRKQLFSSIALVTLAFGVSAVAVGLNEGWSLGDMGRSAGAGGVNAIFSAALTMMLLPLAESFTGITTDLTLLELSDPSRPLLRRLATEAPGTYAHSIAMANLCERACNAIGANGLLARVGCYYHDVGKLANPQYFVENQTAGMNPHDRLSPETSARIIRDHVQAGIDLAVQHGLPTALRDFIPEHHGTAPISFFLERARENGGEPDDLAVFRYPGPRPRSAETAVTMLADAVEASVRVLDDPSREKLGEAVRHIVNIKVAQSQLVDTPLTLQQLDRIQEEFVGVMAGMHHTRIDYPASAGGLSADWEPDDT